MTLSESTHTSSNAPFTMTAIEWVYAHWVSRCVYTVAKLGIADLVKDGSLHCDVLAAKTNTHSDSLYHLLRALASIGIFAETQPRCFGMTPLADCLQSNVNDSIVAEALLRGDEHYYQAWGDLMYSLQTGKSAFEHLYGMDLFQYNDRNPSKGETFDLAMAESEDINASVLAAYDFSAVGKVVDVGGGKGSLLTNILQTYSTLTGVLFDRPDVIDRAKNSCKTSVLSDRLQLIGGDFFKAVTAGGDIYLLKNVIHNWDDRQATSILKCCHQAMSEQARLLVIDAVIPPGNDFYGGKFMDVNMLVMCSGGRDRTEVEFQELFIAAGFKITRIIPTESEVCIIEAIK